MKTKLRVLKVGGNLIDDPKKLKSFLNAFAKLPQPKILVHGGGKIATETSKKLGIESRLIDGRRITSAEELQVITMVYAGLINKNMVASLQALACDAIGLSGADGNTILATIRPKKPIDFGLVGDVEAINSALIQKLLKADLTPVFCAVSHNNKGQLLNTNADSVASEIAIAMSFFYEVELFYCFEKQGVLENVEDENAVIATIDTAKYETLKAAGTIKGGMLPKVQNCFHALNNNVSKVIIGGPEVLNETHKQFTTLKL